MTDAKFKRGHPKKGGKKKGTPNKFTDLKNEFLKAFYDKDGIGGAKGIKELIKSSPRNKMVFLQMISKMLPSNVGIEGNIKHEHSLSMSDLKKSMEEYKK